MSPYASRTRPRKQGRVQVAPLRSILGQHDCEVLEYRFEIPIELFDAKGLFSKARIPKSRWFGTVLPKKRNTKYHVHFRGDIDTRHARIVVEYWNGSRSTARNDTEPYAESMMNWLGNFVKERTRRAFGSAQFRKPAPPWRSRFNLPFRVTMGDAEVAIDGVSMMLPKNRVGAFSAFVARDDKHILSYVNEFRSIDFARFNLADEVAAFDEGAAIFLEQIP